NGFEKTYQLSLVSVQADLKKDMWVMGGDAGTAGMQSQMGNIRPGVAALYSRDYIAQWDRVVAALKPGPYFSNPAATGALTKAPSPLKLVLLELRKNTSFSGGGGAAKSAAMGALQSRMGRAG